MTCAPPTRRWVEEETAVLLLYLILTLFNLHPVLPLASCLHHPGSRSANPISGKASPSSNPPARLLPREHPPPPPPPNLPTPPYGASLCSVTFPRTVLHSSMLHLFPPSLSPLFPLALRAVCSQTFCFCLFVPTGAPYMSSPQQPGSAPCPLSQKQQSSVGS